MQDRTAQDGLCKKKKKKMNEFVEGGGTASPAIFAGYCAIRFPIIPIAKTLSNWPKI